MNKIRKGDTVIVIAGRDKGRQGVVTKVMENGRLLVEGVQLVKKHMRPNPQKNTQGGIVEREAAIQASNVAILNPTSKKADRVGFKLLKDGKKVRIFKSNDEQVDI